MRYYIYEQDGEIVGSNCTEGFAESPYAREVTEEEYRELIGQPCPAPETVITNLQNKNDILKEENKLLKAQIKAQGDRGDFIEDCIAEMATVVYGGV